MNNIFQQILPRLRKNLKRQNFEALLKSCEWVDVGTKNSSKQVYIFTNRNDLVFSANGQVQKGKWELLNNKSLIIDLNNTSSLYYIDFMDSNVLFLNSDNISEYKVFVDSISFDQGIDTLESIKIALEKKYSSNNDLHAHDGHKAQMQSRSSGKTNNSKNAFILQKDSKRVLGIMSMLFGICVISGIIIFDNEYFRFYILNDRSMCPCGANLSGSMDPTFLFIIMIFLVVLGFVLFIRNLEKKF